MEAIHFVVPGDPTAQKRPKFFRRGSFVGTYDPSKKEKDHFLILAYKHKPEVPIDQPIHLTVKFYFPRPKNHYGTGKKSQVLKDGAPKFHSSRPDVDNAYKLCSDALTGVFWKDDSLISSLICQKFYSENPRTEITIQIL